MAQNSYIRGKLRPCKASQGLLGARTDTPEASSGQSRASSVSKARFDLPEAIMTLSGAGKAYQGVAEESRRLNQAF